MTPTAGQVEGLVLVTARESIQLKGKTTSCKVYRLDGLQQDGVELARRLVREDEDGNDVGNSNVSA